MKKFLLVGAVTLTALATAGAAPYLVKARNARGQVIEALPGQVIVKYRTGRSSQVRSRLARTSSVRTVTALRAPNAEILSVPDGETVDSFLKALRDDPDIEYAEPNGIMRATGFQPNDPQLTNQTYLSKIAMYTSAASSAAWDITRGSSTVTIAVLDTGALFNQAEFAGQFVAGNGTTIEIDWNGNHNTTEDDGCRNGLGKDQTEGNPPLDDNYDDCEGDTGIYHGTRTSSIIGAATNNGSGMAGIAHNCKLMAVKVLNNKGVGPFSTVADGIRWATDNGAKVINMSLGASVSDSYLEEQINYALQHDVVIVAAAGNAGNAVPVEYPGALAGVIAVGATTSSDGLANFSCTGSNLDLVAPGVSIRSLSSDNTGLTTVFDDLSGTSFSSPMVAAVAGLIRSIDSTLTYRQVTNYLNNFSDDLGAAGFDTSFGFGRLNAYRSLYAVAHRSTPSINTVFSSNSSAPGKTHPYPNPFNPNSGHVLFRFPPAIAAAFDAKVTVYDIAGETVKELNSSCLDQTGQCEWDGRNDDGNFIASGFYLYRVESSAGALTGKLTVLK